MEGESEMMTSVSSMGEVGGVDARPSLASARKASEEVRKALYDCDQLFFLFLLYFLVRFTCLFFLLGSRCTFICAGSIQ